MCQKIVQLSPNVNPPDRWKKKKLQKIHTPKLRPNTTATRDSNVRDAGRYQRSKHGKNNRQLPQTRVLANNVLQPLTRLNADTVQTASYTQKTIF